MIWFSLGFVIWAVVHSVTAAASTKRVFRQRFGERTYQGLYRLIYNLISLVTFLPLLYLLWSQVPQLALWIIPAPWRYMTMAIQLLALVGLVISLLQTDIWTFVGLRQTARYLSGAADPAVPDKFVSTGTYRWVRHPLYFFSLLFLWLNPVMMLSSFLFNVLATVYFWIGSIYEERRLLAHFGEAYEEYQQAVPSMVPIRIFSRR